MGTEAGAALNEASSGGGWGASKKLFNGDVTTLYLHSAREDQFSVMDFYGQQILPRVPGTVAPAGR